MFRRDLKDNLKDEIMRDGRSISDMFDLIEVAIDLDDKLYKRAMKKRYDQLRERTEIFFESTIEYQQDQFRFDKQKYSNPDYCGPASMKLDSTQYRKEKNPRKKQGNKTKTCYSCGKPDHFARDCRSKNLMISRQINAMLREIFNS
jgi:ribosomal protein S14